MVRNKKNRVFNGVRPQQIVTVSEDNLDSYLSAGFEVYTVKTAKAEAEANSPEATETKEADAERSEEIQERVAFLEEQGVKVGKWGDKRVIKESDKMGYEVEAEGEDVDTTELDDVDAIVDVE